MASRNGAAAALSGCSSHASSASMLPTPRSEDEILESANVRAFSFNELRTATRNFRPDSVLGEGGFGSVFKGWVDEKTLAPARPGTGMVIAVKKLNQDGYQGHKEWLVSILSVSVWRVLFVWSLLVSVFRASLVFFFRIYNTMFPMMCMQTEVNYLGTLSHPYLVKLVGYCLEDEQRLLVYEFMPRGSLENHLFRSKRQPAAHSPLFFCSLLFLTSEGMAIKCFTTVMQGAPISSRCPGTYG